MAATIYVRDVLHRASAQLLDVNPQFVRWTEKELVHWLNDAQRAVAKYLPPAFSRIDAIKLVAGTRQSIESVLAANVKPGDGSTPSGTIHGRALLDVYRNMGSDGLTPGTSIRVVPRKIMDLNNNQWHSAAGGPISCYMFDPRTPKFFYVFPPVPATPDKWVEAAYLIEPIEVPLPTTTLYAYDGTNTTTISIDNSYVDDIVNYILARAHMKESDVPANVQLAAGYTSMFVSSINAQATALTGVNPNLKALPLTPNIPAAAS